MAENSTMRSLEQLWHMPLLLLRLDVGLVKWFLHRVAEPGGVVARSGTCVDFDHDPAAV
jgi:hypothetical protein